MLNEMRSFVGSSSKAFKKKFIGTTFRCPVCHLELAHADVDGNGLVVCPVCGVVMEVAVTYGHTVPVVHDVELFRPQPKSRLHPMAAHFPIGLFPLALAGAVLLFVMSLVGLFAAAIPPCVAAFARHMPVVAEATFVLLFLSVALSTLTFASGFWDWRHRYRQRRYRIITLKLIFAAVFLVVGAAATALHGFGMVFSPTTGLIDLASPTHLVVGALYLTMLLVNMVVIATLGHVGGNLVFGK